MKRRVAGRVWLLAVVVLALAAVSCGDDSPDDAPSGPPPPPGYSRVVGAGFTLDVPATWAQPSLDPQAFEQAAAALRAQNPRLAEVLQESRDSGGNKVFAFDPADGSSVNLIATATGGRSLDELVAQAVTELEQVGATSIQQRRSTLGGRAAVVLEFFLPVRGDAGSLGVPETQYYVARSDSLFILTLFGGSPSLAAIADSVRFK